MSNSLRPLVCMLTLLVPAWSQSTEPSRPKAVTDLLIAETAQRVQRDDALKSVRLNSPALEPWWLSGCVQVAGQWLDYEHAVVVLGNNATLLRYRSERADAQDSSKAHLQLASWAHRNGLPDRERGHLFTALTLEPKLQTRESMQRLGFEQNSGQWCSPEWLQQLRREVKAIETSSRKWGRKLVALRNQLSRSASAKVEALAELERIRDPEAVAAIDIILGRNGDEGTRLAIKALSGINCYEASLVLAKYATFHPNPGVRRQAIDALRDRPFGDFVPSLLELTATETEVTAVPSTLGMRSVGGNMLMREVAFDLMFVRETEKQIQVARSSTRVNVNYKVHAYRLGMPGTDIYVVRDGWELLSRMVEQRAYSQISRVDELNELTRETNGRIASILAMLSNREPVSDPTYWWNWWYREADIDPGTKSIVEVSEVSEESVQVPIYVRISCFAAGTPVWTETGLQPIEDVRVGDLVLAKSVETGELAFKPVMKTTVRSAKPLKRIQFGDAAIDATGGHHFFSSGRGWVKARDLESTARVHSVTGNVPVTAVGDGPSEPTFNLIVEGFHTYFVGKSGLLVQDLLLPAPTNTVVPGLTRYELQTALGAN